MDAPAQVSVRNRLLAALSPADFSLLEPHLEPSPVLVGTQLVEPNTPIKRVYFLEAGIASNAGATHEGLRSYDWGTFGEVTAAETLQNPATGGISGQIAGLSWA